ncbi:diaminopimelate epimerase [Kordiimonas gwangyangensis]|uniref:diaminopimelate epimerase n=1 Tax=Kordiimonas gwangyangensis TaxID=288022 RepID=UPI00039A63F1|nr:diaminopimelate epimerase [Kordiimonas gwangyangensis]
MSTSGNTYRFRKMEGLGNDFVIFDAREHDLTLSDDAVRHIADRKRGVGCDQLIVMRGCQDADIFMEIRNADGSRVGACGNATRCVGRLMLDETGKEAVTIRTDAGLLGATRADTGISVNMGPARLAWSEIPLAEVQDTANIAFELDGLLNPVGVNMGNPHAVFFVDDAEAIDLKTLGPKIEHDVLFPERVNVSVAHVKDGIIRQRVWERGVGITDACGTGACAGLVAAARRGLTGRKATVMLDGGPLEIEWLEDGTVQMTGAATLAYTGEIVL